MFSPPQQNFSRTPMFTGAQSNRKHGLFHIRYFENGPVELGYTFRNLSRNLRYFIKIICSILNARALTAWRRKLDVTKESSCASVTNKFHSGKLCSAPPNKIFPVRRCLREPNQTVNTVYFILGILRTDLWS